jgi:hypothetical protein
MTSEVANGAAEAIARAPSPAPIEASARGPGVALDAGARRARRRAWLWRAALVALPLALAVVYLSNGTRFQGNDTIGSAATALSLIRDGDFDITELTKRSHPAYWFQVVGGRTLSTYGFGAPLVAAPFFEALDLLVFRHHWSFERLMIAGKVTGALTAAVSALLLAVTARRFAGALAALAVALVFGLATSTWSVTSQGLWQHGPAALGLTAALAMAFFPAAARPPIALVAASALPLGLAVWCRESLVPLFPAVAAYLFVVRRRAVLPFLALGAVMGAGLMALNAHHLGSPFVSAVRLFAERRAAADGVGLWDTPLAVGTFALLFSPSRGLFVYSPILLLSLAGAWLGRRDRERAAWMLLVAGAVIAVASVLKWHWWWGGDTYGPRLCADALPFLVLLLLPVWPRLVASRSALALAAVLAAFSVYVHGVGAWTWDGVSWDERTAEEAIDKHPERLFSIRDSQLGFYLRLPRTEPQRIPWR